VYRKFANQLARNFQAQHPNQKWVVDITYIDAVEGWYKRRRWHSSLDYLSPDQFESYYDWTV
jgi:transposase InsO family protein